MDDSDGLPMILLAFSKDLTDSGQVNNCFVFSLPTKRTLSN